MAKPQVLMCTTPFYGHFAPISYIAKELVSRGFDVTFVTASFYRKHIENIGASFVPFIGFADFTEDQIPTIWPERATKAVGIEQLTYDLEHCFMDAIPSQHEAVQRALKLINSIHPGAPVVVINEYMLFGMMPTILGAGEYRPTATIGLGIIPLCLGSVDLPPFGPGLPPDSSPEGRERNKAMRDGFANHVMASVTASLEKHLKSLGARPAKEFFLDAGVLLMDRFLQCCTPSVEYPRSDAPSTLMYTGGIPKPTNLTWEPKPIWWNEVIENSEGKRIILVGQGTVARNYEELVIPTIRAMEDRQDVLVLVALGFRGATLPAGTSLASNARINDWIPYDVVLPHCDLFVSNGGYGSFQHATYNGVPLVVAGGTEDKPEVCARAEWSGVAVNLKTATPTVDMVKESIDKVLMDVKYKKRALQLQAEMRTYNPLSVIVESIEELGAAKTRQNGQA